MSSTHNRLCFNELSEKAAAAPRRGRSHHRPGLDWLAPVSDVHQVNSPTHDALLVGPSDQYAVGEMLKPHVLTRLLNFSRFRCAGLAGIDRTAVGGHAVRNYGEGALEMGGKQLQLLHFGTDSISEHLVDGYPKAVDEEEAERFESLAVISGDEELNTYVRRRTGQLNDFAYMLAPEGEFYGARTSFHAVGLADPDTMNTEMRDRLVSQMRRADFVGISDENGADFLEKEGVDVHRMPCSLSVIPQVCARQLREHRDSEALEAVRDRFPNGWIAVEIGTAMPADFEKLTSALRDVSEEEGLGLVFFDASRQGTASTRRWVKAFPEWNAASFGSDNIWEIASLLLHSRLYCGTSLDCRVICMSGGVARINIPTESNATRSYCELWEHDEMPIEFSNEEDWKVAFAEALRVGLSTLQEHAGDLHREYFEALAKFCECTGLVPKMLPESVETPHMRAASRLHHLQDEWLSDEASLKLFRDLNRKVGKRSMASQIKQKLGLQRQRA
ncbi:MAG: hypothetical protein HRU46_16800 [Verrucomicrobiales bacterium]|nr:hypothetical protein [Verrucomicrobiales bacterium]